MAPYSRPDAVGIIFQLNNRFRGHFLCPRASKVAPSIMLDILSFRASTRIDSFRAHYILAVSDLKMRVFQGQEEMQPLVALLTVGLGANLEFCDPYRVLTVQRPWVRIPSVSV